MKLSHLPHRDIKELYQFVTFRTYDSTDAFLQKLEQQNNLDNSKKQMQINDKLDYLNKGCYFYTDKLSYFYSLLKENDKILYDLIAFAIMPNHIHILFKPHERLPLIMQKIKGKSALELNKRLGRKGTFWLKDYYDKGIRDRHHFNIVYAYIKNNPMKLPENNRAGRFYGIYE